MLEAEEKDMVLRSLLQLALKMRSYTSRTAPGSDKFLKYVMERDIAEDRRESVKSAGKNGAVRERADDEHVFEAANEARVE